MSKTQDIKQRDLDVKTPGGPLADAQMPPQAKEAEAAPNPLDSLTAEQRDAMEAEMAQRLKIDRRSRQVVNPNPDGLPTQLEAKETANKKNRAAMSVDGWVCPDPPAEPVIPRQVMR